MANEREWVRVEVLWDADSHREADYRGDEQTADELGDPSARWLGFSSTPQDGGHLSKRKRKKLRGQGRQSER